MGLFLVYKNVKIYVQHLETLMLGSRVINLTVVGVVANKILTVYKVRCSNPLCNVYIDIA